MARAMASGVAVGDLSSAAYAATVGHAWAAPAQ